MGSPSSSLKIIIAMDVGTQMSSASYLYCQPNIPNRVKRVKQWPSQGWESSNVPSVIYYKNGKPHRYGVDHADPAIKSLADDEKWHLVKEFKRWVHHLETNDVGPADISDFLALPVALPSIYNDWLSWLFQVTLSNIHQDYNIPQDIWKKRQFIFTVPNGWSEPEQSVLRELIRKAGCVEDKRNIHFVRESDAALRYVLHHGVTAPTKNSELMICDAGSSTTDIALYKVVNTNPFKVEELEKAPSMSIEAGLSLAEELYDGIVAKEELDSSAEGPDAEDANEIARHLALDQELNKILAAINNLKKAHKPQILILEGGFFNDPYVYEQVRRNYSPQGIEIIQRGDSRWRGTPDGAIYCYLQNFVRARASHYAFGTDVLEVYKPNSPDHQQRQKHTSALGLVVHDRFHELVSPGQILREGDPPVKTSFYFPYSSQPRDLSRIQVELYACAANVDRKWVRSADGTRLNDGFIVICKIQADLSEMQGKLPQSGSNPKIYRLNFELAIDFGATDSRAIIYWKDDKGVARSKDAIFIPPQEAMEAWEHTIHTNAN